MVRSFLQTAWPAVEAQAGVRNMGWTQWRSPPPRDESVPTNEIRILVDGLVDMAIETAGGRA